MPAQVVLGEAAMAAGNGAAVARQVAGLRELGSEAVAEVEAAVLDARWKTAQGNHAGIDPVLEAAITEQPGALALPHARIVADAAPRLLEAAFRGVLALYPTTPGPRATSKCCSA